MTRVALYCRVSTADQHPENQVEPLRQYARARGWEVVEVFADHGVSGAKARRPALDRLLADTRGGRFDAIVISKLDRLARSVHHLTSLALELEALQVDLVVTDQGIDTSTPTGRLLFNMLGAIAEFERDLIRERTVAGLAQARRRGKILGRPRKLAGVLHQKTIEDGLARGRSLRSIARELGVSPATVAAEARRLEAAAP